MMGKICRWCMYIMTVVAWFWLGPLTFAAMIHVPADQPTIQSGIDAAENGDTVLVSDGIYTGAGNVNISFSGKQITVKSRSGADATIIDCEETPNTRGFTFESKETHTSVLDGFTIRNGVHDLGGGIYCHTASPTIQNCIITQNRGTATRFRGQSAGGVYGTDTNVHITDCTVTQNRGCGVVFEGERAWTFNTFRSTTLANCTISENTDSGVICQDLAPVTIKDCTVLQNGERGIMCTFFTRGISITHCRIEQNTGGGIECSEESFAKIEDCIIKQNRAVHGGGIYCSPTSEIEVSGCIIAQNTATETGGGIDVISTRGLATITHCTITQNTAHDRGGGISTFIEFSQFTLTNSIVWDNHSHGKHPEISPGGRQVIIKSCDIRGGFAGMDREPDDEWFIYENNIDADPRFINPENGDYRLESNSPAASMGARPPLGGITAVTHKEKRLVTWGELKIK
ncbi:hypothetical protein F4Y19_10265 [Candidatus Poribacteria bacterium]|nr:hypothetical protein [Candidatus Poribacteria bacterium]